LLHFTAARTFGIAIKYFSLT